MFQLLPQPQELFALPEVWRGGPDDRLFSTLAPDDEALRALARALAACTGREPRIERLDAPAWAERALAVAASPAQALKLIGQAAAQWAEPVRQEAYCLDGGNMHEPMDGMGKPAAPAGGVGGIPEAYALRITAEGLAAAGVGRAGIYYAAQTLVQLLDGRSGTCPGVLVRDFPAQAIRGIHVDMKYAFHKPETLEELLRQLGCLKLNHALFEYEDKFPYRRHPAIVDRRTALSPEWIARLRETARRNRVELIPLIQTLGHLEFALKHPQYAHLREVPAGLTMVCPRKPESLRFVQDLVDDVLEAHPEARFLHIGGDETFLLGHCPACKAMAQKDGKVAVYAEHIAAVCQYVLAKGVRPIVWDDMVRSSPRHLSVLPKNTVLAYWVYETVRERHGQRKVPAELERFYGCAGKRPPELPDALSTYPFFDFYRQQGYDVIAVPCFNVGTLVPVQDLTGRNTATWAEKSASHGGLGMLNSSWACYLTHLDATWYGIAQTADASWWWPSVNRTSFDARFAQAFFGLPTPEIGTALHALGAGVGVPTKLRRPFSLLTFAYMEGVIHFEGNMALRQAMGPFVIEGLDLLNHILRKLETVRADGLAGEVVRQIESVEPLFESALRRLTALQSQVTRNGEILALLALCAEIKSQRCALWRFFLSLPEPAGAVPDQPTRGQAARLLQTERGLRARFHALHAAKLNPPDADYVTGKFFDGEARFLELLAEGQPIPAPYRNKVAQWIDDAEDVRDV